MFTFQVIKYFSGQVINFRKAGQVDNNFTDEVNKNNFPDQVISSDRDLKFPCALTIISLDYRLKENSQIH